MPAIVTIIVSLPLNKVFKVIVLHLTVKDCFNLVFVFAIDEHWCWRGGSLTSWNGVWESNGEFDNREDEVKVLEVWWQGEAVGTMANTSLNGEGAKV
jgi:hypothetical protein